MNKETLTVKDLDGQTIIQFVIWYYTPEEIGDIYGDVIVENSKGEQVLSW